MHGQNHIKFVNLVDFITKKPCSYLLDMRLDGFQIRSGFLGEKIKLLHLLDIETRNFSARSLFTVPIELPGLSSSYANICVCGGL